MKRKELTRIAVTSWAASFALAAGRGAFCDLYTAEMLAELQMGRTMAVLA